VKYERGKGYHAKIILDSIGPSGCRLTTFQLRYPRMVHSELLTHRLFSRNSSSSRAIPNERLIAQVLDDPAMPVWWGKNQSGMQAREALSAEPSVMCRMCGRDNVPGVDVWTPGTLVGCHDFRSEQDLAVDEWLRGRDEAVALSRRLAATGLHKQIANRVIEPWMFITVLVSATEYTNWFALRDHTDAQPEIAWIARLMNVAYHESEPEEVDEGGWHLPFLTEEERDAIDCSGGWSLADARKVSVGRCARVSYLTHDGKRAPGEDMQLHDRLAGSSPGHWSPFEHVAQALVAPAASGNFRGWAQYRKTFIDEHVGGLRP
jgi:Thymidylate synthase complementing protein